MAVQVQSAVFPSQARRPLCLLALVRMRVGAKRRERAAQLAHGPCSVVRARVARGQLHEAADRQPVARNLHVERAFSHRPGEPPAELGRRARRALPSLRVLRALGAAQLELAAERERAMRGLQAVQLGQVGHAHAHDR